MSIDNNDAPESIENEEAMDAGAEASTDEAVEADSLESLQEELAAAKDAALRAQADAVNIQRRAEMDVEKARKFALERFVSDLLPVVDNLERALEASGSAEAHDAVVEGVELTLKSLIDVLEKNGVTAVDPHGQTFDPQVAQAMSMIENPDVEPNTVIGVMQKGYLLKDRLLRPAMVMVSKAAS